MNTKTIKMPRRHFLRTFSALEETRSTISKMSDLKLISEYKAHESALMALLEVAEPIDGTKFFEEVEMASTVSNFIREFKSSTAVA